MNNYYNYMVSKKSSLDNPYETPEQGPGYESMGEGAGEGSGMEQSAGVGAAGAAASGNPYMAAASIGGQFLSQYLAAKAAQERQKQALAMKAEENYSNDQNNAFKSLMGTYRSALR